MLLVACELVQLNGDSLMPMRVALLLALSVLLTGWGDRDLDLPYAGPMPDQPVEVPHKHYDSILSGTRSYRPIDPLPWGDVNRRVTPGAQSAPPAGATDAPSPNGMTGHGHH